jgi:ubiquitin-conjugating enzyme (huntingtin interacting protein 2)
MKGIIEGPEGSPYAAGIFLLDICLPQSYPFEPPRVKFVTKIWHPNVSSESGAICIDILKTAWSPALSIKTVLLSIQYMLQVPEPDDPQVYLGLGLPRVMSAYDYCRTMSSLLSIRTISKNTKIQRRIGLKFMRWQSQTQV